MRISIGSIHYKIFLHFVLVFTVMSEFFYAFYCICWLHLNLCCIWIFKFAKFINCFSVLLFLVFFFILPFQHYSFCFALTRFKKGNLLGFAKHASLPSPIKCNCQASSRPPPVPGSTIFSHNVHLFALILSSFAWRTASFGIWSFASHSIVRWSW